MGAGARLGAALPDKAERHEHAHLLLTSAEDEWHEHPPRLECFHSPGDGTVLAFFSSTHDLSGIRKGNKE